MASSGEGSQLQDRGALQALLRQACTRAGYAGVVELPTSVAIELAALIVEVDRRERQEALQGEALFKERIPESAARQLAIVLASSTEEHLGSLERLSRLKSSSRREVECLQEVCARMVAQCADLGVEPIGLRGERCRRLDAALKDRR